MEEMQEIVRNNSCPACDIPFILNIITEGGRDCLSLNRDRPRRLLVW
jgi:hypothetical protein